MTECNGCGCCCDPVVSPFTKPMMVKLLVMAATGQDGGKVTPADRADFEFALVHLTPIPREDGLARAPYLTQGGETQLTDLSGEHAVTVESQFYSCDRFDPETRRCTAYDDRPPMCSGFPFYDQPADHMWNASKALPQQCSFRADIGQPVELGPTRATSAAHARGGRRQAFR